MNESKNQNKWDSMIPCEFMVMELLPTIRKETAKFLLSRNYSQKEISKIMQVSEAAVSQYIKRKRGRHKKELERIISKYIYQSYDINKSFAENICEMCTFFRKSNYFCKSHKLISKISDQSCRSCNVKFSIH